MNSLSSAIASNLSRYYQDRADALHSLVDPLTDNQLWTRPYAYGNSIGNLLLHLTGNLSYYIGAEIGGTGYVRNRALEFSEESRAPKADVLQKFDAALALVRATLEKQSEPDWSAAFAGKGLEFAENRFYAFVLCAGHLSHHLGQMIYLCKELEKQKT